MWRTATDAQKFIEKAEEGIKTLGDESEVNWEKIAEENGIDLKERCM